MSGGGEFFFLQNLWKVLHFHKISALRANDTRKYADNMPDDLSNVFGQHYSDKMRIFPCEHFFISNKKLRKEGDQKQRFFFFLPKMWSSTGSVLGPLLFLIYSKRYWKLYGLYGTTLCIDTNGFVKKVRGRQTKVRGRKSKKILSFFKDILILNFISLYF